MPGLALVLDHRLPKAGQRDQSAQEPVRLPQAAQLLDDAPAHDAEVAGVRGYLDIGDAVYQRIAERRDRALDDRLALPADPAGGDDVIALLGLREESCDEFRRILEVGIDHHAPLA